MFNKLRCNLNGHQVDRSRVWNDGLQFRGECLRCGQTMLKDRHGWRDFDETKDADPRRHAPPAVDQEAG